MSLALAVAMLIPITVHTMPGISPGMVKKALTEVDAIWRDVGVEFEWRTRDDEQAPALLHVEVGDKTGQAPARELPLAWIGFVDGLPDRDIYVSRSNAYELLLETPGRGRATDLPAAAINEYVGRALGRALAHEIGHYLFRSPAHDVDGIMATRRSAVELFGPDRRRFRLTADERSRLTDALERNRMANRATAPGQ